MNGPLITKMAQNTFTDGLIMDFNNLVTPSSALTNCLNGTNITFNGNEFMLQNDMGNGRVETAYLPTGYVPIGIKEYGGIIYVVSVDPLNNKCQIGSFPSPERNLTPNDFGEKDKYSAIYNDTPSLLYRKQVTPDDIEITAGDLFYIELQLNTGQGTSDPALFKKLINTCFNLTKSTTGTKEDVKISSPKRKTFNFSLVVESPDHTLVDITNTLTRIANENFDGLTDAEKANYGYYLLLSDLVTHNVELASMADNSQLNPNTQQVELTPASDEDSEPLFQLLGSSVDAGTESKPYQYYKGKISGSLYLVCTFNSVDSFDVSWSNLRTEEGESTQGETQEATTVRQDLFEDEGNENEISDYKPLTDELTEIEVHPKLPDNPVPVLDIDVQIGTNYHYVQILVTSLNDYPDIEFRVNDEEEVIYTFNPKTLTGNDVTVPDYLYFSQNKFSCIYYYSRDEELVSKLLASPYLNFTVYYTDAIKQEMPVASLCITKSKVSTDRNNTHFLLNEIDNLNLPANYTINVQNSILKQSYSFHNLEVSALTDDRLLVYVTKNGTTNICDALIFMPNSTSEDEHTYRFTPTVEKGTTATITSYSVDIYQAESRTLPAGFTYELALASVTGGASYSFPTILSEEPGLDAETDYSHVDIEQNMPIWAYKETYWVAPGTDFTILNLSSYEFIQHSTSEQLEINEPSFVTLQGEPVGVSDVEFKPNLVGEWKVLWKVKGSDNVYEIATGTSEPTWALSHITTPGFYSIRANSKTGLLTPWTDYFYIPPTKTGNLSVSGNLVLDYYYNCPDGVYDDNVSAFPDNKEQITGSYASYYGKSVDFVEPSLLGSELTLTMEGENTSHTYNVPFQLANDDSPIVYNPITKLYHSRQTISVSFNNVFNSDAPFTLDDLKTVTYKATPYMNFGVGPLNDLTKTGTINLAKVGTGEVTLTTWKYFYGGDESDITILWGVENYLLDDLVLTNPRVTFYDVAFNDAQGLTFQFQNRPNINGIYTDTISAAELTNKTMYLVKLEADKVSESETITIVLGYRWLLTSRLFNPMYSNSNVHDFADEYNLETIAQRDSLRAIKCSLTCNVEKKLSKPTEGEKLITEAYYLADQSEVKVYETLVSNDQEDIPTPSANNTTKDVKAVITELYNRTYDVTINASFDYDLYPITDISYDATYSCLVDSLLEQPQLLSSGNQFHLVSASQDGYIAIEHDLGYWNCKSLNIQAATVPAYKLYAASVSDKIPSIIIYGFSNDSKHYAKFHVGAVDGEGIETNMYEVQGRDADTVTKFRNAYMYLAYATGSLSMSLGYPTIATTIWNDLVNRQDFYNFLYRKGVPTYPKCFRLDWCQGYAGKNAKTRDDSKHPNQYFYFLRCDSLVAGTEDPNSVAYRVLNAKPCLEKYDTLYDVLVNLKPELANILVQDEDSASTTYYAVTLTNGESIKETTTALKCIVSMDLSNLVFLTSRTEEDDLEDTSLTDYNNAIDLGINSILGTSEYDFLRDLMKMYINTSASIVKTITLETLTSSLKDFFSAPKELNNVLAYHPVKGSDLLRILDMPADMNNSIYYYNNGSISRVESDIIQVGNDFRINYLVQTDSSTAAQANLNFLKAATGWNEYYTELEATLKVGVIRVDRTEADRVIHLNDAIII